MMCLVREQKPWIRIEGNKEKKYGLEKMILFKNYTPNVNIWSFKMNVCLSYEIVERNGKLNNFKYGHLIFNFFKLDMRKKQVCWHMYLCHNWLQCRVPHTHRWISQVHQCNCHVHYTGPAHNSPYLRQHICHQNMCPAQLLKTIHNISTIRNCTDFSAIKSHL